MKHYTLFILFALSAIAFTACQKDDPIPESSVVLKDLRIAPLYTTADIQCDIVCNSSIQQVTLEYSQDSTFSTFEQLPMAKASQAVDEQQYAIHLSALTDSTKYFIRCRAINQISSAVSNINNFMTKAFCLPEVSTDSISNITISSAIINATLTDWGRDTLPDEIGFCWAQNENATIKDSIVIYNINDNTTSFPYSCALQDLEDNTTYYVRAYAKNIKGVAYGKELSFTTIEILPPSVQVAILSNITDTTVYAESEIEVDGGSPITSCGFCYSTSPNPTIADNKLMTSLTDFKTTIEGLTPGTTYHIRAWAENKKCVGYSDEITFTTQTYSAPTVTTSSATNIDYTSATCGGNVTADGGQTVTARGICYSTTTNPTIANNKVTSGSGTGTFTCNITGLTAGMKYYVRAYATNCKGTSYGDELSFTTAAYGVPTVTTSAVTNVSYSTATCGGDVTADGGQTVTERGICYSTSQNPTIANNKIVSGSGKGTFTCELTGLTAETTYHTRAYAINNRGISYGEDIVFTTTAQLPSVSIVIISNVSYTTVTCQGSVINSGGKTVTERGFCYATHPNPTIADNIIVKGSGVGDFSTTIKDLVTNQTYYLCVYAKNSVGITYGASVSFTTLPTRGEDGGYQWVDLGLSVKWASTNIGACSPEEYGAYYAWGELQPKSQYTYCNYIYCQGTKTSMTKYCTSSSYGSIDNKTELELSDDVAHAERGSTWRIPSYNEWYELRSNCTIKFRVNYNGVVGTTFISRINGDSIFLPAAGHKTSNYDCSYPHAEYIGESGCYSSRTLDTNNNSFVKAIYLADYVGFSTDRCNGLTIRPICQ